MDEVKRIKILIKEIEREGVIALKYKKVKQKDIDNLLLGLRKASKGARDVYKIINSLPPIDAERMKQSMEQLFLNTYYCVKSRWLKRGYFFLKELYLLVNCYMILGELYKKY